MLDAFHGMVEIVTALMGVAILALAFSIFRSQIFSAHRRVVMLLVTSAIIFFSAEFYDLLDVVLTSIQIELARELSKVAYLSTSVAALLLLLLSTRQEMTLLRRAADTDELTQVHNQGSFRRLGQWRLARARENNLPLALLMLDVDDFKSYNDSYGHEAGNAALRRIAQVMQDSLRANDVLARYGGEEFAALVASTLEDALHLAERMRRQAEMRCSPEQDPALQRQLTLSVGVARMSGETATLEQLIEAADAELYRAKEAGKNRVFPPVPVAPATGSS